MLIIVLHEIFLWSCLLASLFLTVLVAGLPFEDVDEGKVICNEGVSSVFAIDNAIGEEEFHPFFIFSYCSCVGICTCNFWGVSHPS